jgi:hypothetical protein
MKYFLIFALFLIGCGEEGPTKPCNLLVGNYEITSTVMKTDCPEMFGEADGQPKNNGTIWTMDKVDDFKCGETKKKRWDQVVKLFPCECSMVYNDYYHSITENSFVLNRRIDLECFPYLDPSDEGCNKECFAEGFIEGKKVEDDQIKSGQ